MQRIGATTWLVLITGILVGLVAIVMTVVVVVRLNRQILASAAEFRVARGLTSPVGSDDARIELLKYAATRTAIENEWADAQADMLARYPNDPNYANAVTAVTVRAVNGLRRLSSVSGIHERWAQAWSDREAAMRIPANASADEKLKASELARKASDEIRRTRNELQDLLNTAGATDQEILAALGSARTAP